jgi:ATP-dependent Clp protease adapter protein ClpS
VSLGDSALQIGLLIMAEHDTTPSSPSNPVQTDAPGATATVVRPARPKIDRLPPWQVLLHNDDVNEMGYVMRTIVSLTPLDEQAALVRMLEAHESGVSLLMQTHREHAELLQEQFTSKFLVVTIEPAPS